VAKTTMLWKLGSKQSTAGIGHCSISSALVVYGDSLHVIHHHCTVMRADGALGKILLGWVPQNPILQTSALCLIVQQGCLLPAVHVDALIFRVLLFTFQIFCVEDGKGSNHFFPWLSIMSNRTGSLLFLAFIHHLLMEHK
jgi:hypothetical protein